MSGERRDAAASAAHAVLIDSHFGRDTRDLLARAIADAIEAALTWAPPPVLLQLEVGPIPDPIARGTWSCGCPSTDCRIRSDIWRDASADPHAVIRLTCTTHGLVGKSDLHPAGDARPPFAQAMMLLDVKHQEQCR